MAAADQEEAPGGGAAEADQGGERLAPGLTGRLIVSTIRGREVSIMPRNLLPFALVVVAAASCGKPPSEPGRLRQNVLMAEDGSTINLQGQFFDTKRQEDCTFMRLGDRWRCMPPYAVDTGTVYADVGCTQPAVVTSPCTKEVKYALRQPTVAGQCTAEVQVFRLKAAVPGGAGYQKQGPGSCMLIWQSGQYAIYPLADAVPLNEFVGADLGTR